jgi:hypothetical protein
MVNGDGSAEAYVQKLDLPEAGPQFETVRRLSWTDAQEAAAVGSQLVEFAAGVPGDVRDAIADSVLLAQLAANKAAGQAHDVIRWYDKYIEVLQNIGWQLRDVDFQMRQVTDANASLHQEIIPVLTALLGPHAAAASIVLSVLNGLQAMDRDSPWITVFDRASQQAHGAKLQVSYVQQDASGDPEINLLAFGIRAERTITQVLFFKFKAQNAELKQASGKMGVSIARLNSAKDLIAQRVTPFVSGYVAKLDI